MRKISLINGTTNGMKTNSEGQLVYDIAVFGTFNLKAFYNVDRNLATPGNSVTTFEGRFTKEILCGIPFTNMTYLCELIITDAWRNDVNTNPRGCMDVVPGGTSDTVGAIKKSIDENPAIQENRVENRVFVPNHAFIPTVSSLAFKNPNFDWSTPLNRNLVCDPANKEIPFDSYFSPSKNEKHVYLSKESVDWLLAEIQGNPQVPSFDVNQNQLIGPNLICNNQTATYSFGNDICKLPSEVTWSVTPNAQITTPNNYSVIIKGVSNGPATITATFQNGQTFEKKIWVGTPDIDLLLESFGNTVDAYVIGGHNTILNQQGISSIEWIKLGFDNGDIKGHGSGSGYFGHFHGNSYNWVLHYKITVTNICGSKDFIFDISCAPPPDCDDLYILLPNTTNGYAARNVIDPCTQDRNGDSTLTANSDIIWAKLFDWNKNEVRNYTENEFSLDGLKSGIYILKVQIKKRILSKKIIVP